MTSRCRTLCVIVLLAGGCASGEFYIEPAAGETANLFKSSRVFADDAGPTNAVIRSPSDWEALLADYPTSNAEYARDRFWRVDYNRHMVVGVVLGARWSGSISVNVDSLRVRDQRMVVYATEHRPGTQHRDRGNPAHFVVIERTNLPVEFAEVLVVAE